MEVGVDTLPRSHSERNYKTKRPSLVDTGAELQGKHHVHLLNSIPPSTVTTALLSPVLKIREGKKRFGKELFKVVSSTKRERLKVQQAETKIAKLKQAKAKQEADIENLQKYEERLESKRQQHRDWMNSIAEKKTANEMILAEKRERIRKDAQERKQRLEQSKLENTQKRRTDASQMRNENKYLKEVRQSQEAQDLSILRAKASECDTKIRNTRKYQVQKDEERQEARRAEMEQLVMDHIEEREILIQKRQELKKEQQELISGFRNVVSKRKEVGNRLEEKVRNSMDWQSPSRPSTNSPQDLQVETVEAPTKTNLRLSQSPDLDVQAGESNRPSQPSSKGISKHTYQNQDTPIVATAVKQALAESKIQKAIQSRILSGRGRSPVVDTEPCSK